MNKQNPTIVWYNVESWGIEGKGWHDTARYFDRLPARAEERVREPVWDLSRHTAGMCVRFVTDATAIHVRYALLHEQLAMAHMPASGVSGLDLYAEDEDGAERWLSIVAPLEQSIDTMIAQNLVPGSRRYTIYLPLFNGVECLEVGIAEGDSFVTEAPRNEPPIVFYGTSITHGACASRAGMSFPAILGRTLRRPTINLGFSGNGQMEIELADLLTELDPCIYVIDCLPNMTPELVAERTEPLVHRLREARSETPILLVEDRTFTNARFLQSHLELHGRRRAALRTSYENLIADDVPDLHYMEGAGILGHDGEATTDGSHPNDLGMMRYAEVYEKVLRELI